jgi:nucleotide-binding universal stress UspA family protein
MTTRTEGQSRELKGRIAVAFASESLDLFALDAVTRLAASLHAEIAGIFVEDINLIRLAGLPVARAVSRSGAPQTLDVAEMERQLRTQAETVRVKFASLAERAGVRWSFAISRGSLAGEIVRAAGEGDIVVVGLTRRAVLAETMALGPARRRGVEPELQRRPIAVVFTGSAASQRALRLATTLSDTLAQPLTILLVAKDESSGAALKSEAQSLIAPRQARFQSLVDPTVAILRDATESAHAAILVIEQGAAILDPAAVELLNDALSCPSLIVR